MKQAGQNAPCGGRQRRERRIGHAAEARVERAERGRSAWREETAWRVRTGDTTENGRIKPPPGVSRSPTHPCAPAPAR